MTESKLYGMLGLAKRAGKVVSGADAVIDRVRTKSAFLVIISSDVSEATNKRITDKCNFYETTKIIYGTSEVNGKTIGKADVAAIAVTDKNFADTILRLYKNLTEVAENGSC